MRSKSSRWATRKAVVVSAVLVLMTVTAVAVAVTVKTNGGPVTAVYTVTGDEPPLRGQSTSYVDVAGMSTTVTVPSRERASLLITFSAHSECHWSGPLCLVRVTVGGVAARPGEVVFDTVRDGDTDNVGVKGTSGETNSMQFVAGPLPEGQHVVKVQYKVSAGGTHFELYKRTLSVLRFNAA